MINPTHLAPSLIFGWAFRWETDLAQAFPLATVVKWLGNTPAVAMRHYVDVTDEAFERAKRWRPSGTGEDIYSPCGTKCGTVLAQNAAQQASAPVCKEERFLTQSLVDFQLTQSFFKPVELVQTCIAERTGFEPAEG